MREEKGRISGWAWELAFSVWEFQGGASREGFVQQYLEGGGGGLWRLGDCGKNPTILGIQGGKDIQIPPRFPPHFVQIPGGVSIFTRADDFGGDETQVAGPPRDRGVIWGLCFVCKPLTRGAHG